MFWVCIIGSKIIGPLNFDNGIKINGENYYIFMDKTFLTGANYNQETLS